MMHNGNTPAEEQQKTGNWYRNPDWVMVMLTAFVFVVGVCTALVFNGQFGEMQKQTELIKEQAHQASIDSAVSAAQTQKQIDILREQARAAENSVRAIREQMRQDQRPWLVVSSAAKPEQPIAQRGDEVAVDLLLANRGKTVATDVRGTFVVALIMRGHEVAFQYHNKIAPAAHYDIGAIFPNSYPVPLHVPLLQWQRPPHKPKPLRMRDLGHSLGTSFYLVVYGKVTYRDGFSTKHWTALLCQLCR